MQKATGSRDGALSPTKLFLPFNGLPPASIWESSFPMPILSSRLCSIETTKPNRSCILSANSCITAAWLAHLPGSESETARFKALLLQLLLLPLLLMLVTLSLLVLLLLLLWLLWWWLLLLLLLLLFLFLFLLLFFFLSLFLLVCETCSAHVDHFHTMQVSLRKRDSAAALAFAILTSPLKIRDMSWHRTNWLNLLRSSGANPQGCLAANRLKCFQGPNRAR